MLYVVAERANLGLPVALAHVGVCDWFLDGRVLHGKEVRGPMLGNDFNHCVCSFGEERNLFLYEVLPLDAYQRLHMMLLLFDDCFPRGENQGLAHQHEVDDTSH